MAGTPTNTTANTNKWSTRQLVTMALMTAIGVLLSFIEFPLLPGVTWLKFDASNMPAMVAGFAYGPGGGVAVGILTAAADSEEDITAEENDEPTIKM